MCERRYTPEAVAELQQIAANCERQKIEQSALIEFGCGGGGMDNQALSFVDVLGVAASTPELVEQFNRLTGCNLGQSANRTALDIAIDQATGYSGEQPEDMTKFIAFVYEVIWLRLPDEVRAQPA